QNLSRLMFEGPEDELTLTANAQPAIMASSLAALRVLEEGGIRLSEKARYVAGHSLGEYSALSAADALSVDETARLLRIRGDAMQAAVAPGEGAMAAILGLDHDAVIRIAEEASGDDGIVAAANDNAPGQVVISGHAAAVDRAIALAKAAGARRAMALSVSAPFHCALMQPAADAMEKALASARLSAPVVPLIANVTAAAVTDPATIRQLLVEQVTGAVRWRESVLHLAELGVDRFVEFGGKVLGPMVKRIVPDATIYSLVSMDDAEQIAKNL
ncbi:MAG: ACP S-malonyltransferase, partial [Sphingomonadaceae bacterium]